MKLLNHFIIAVLFCIYTLPSNAFTILLAPAGHASDPGRQLNNSCERAIAYEWAQAVQKELLQRYPHINVIMSRSPGETLFPLQLASFANRIPVDLVISFNLFLHETEKPQLYLYHHTFNSFLEDYSVTEQTIDFIPVQKAHIGKRKTTIFWAKNLENSLKSNKNSCFFDCVATQGLPFKPLYGILAPAIALELGIQKEAQWKETVQAIATALEFLSF